MNGAEAILFTGGIGENSAAIRERICQEMSFFGIALDRAKNAAMVNGQEGEISAADARLQVFVVPTNEELLIARDTVRCVLARP
jgi:acetate kinase